MGLTGALGTTAEHIDGVYTGRLKGDLLHGPAKAEAIRALAREHGFDLAHCFAYSDSYNDLPMLSLVGHPCAINPDGRLLAHAEEQDWQIQDYRSGRQGGAAGTARRWRCRRYSWRGCYRGCGSPHLEGPLRQAFSSCGS